MEIGDVIYVTLDSSNGIKPHAGFSSRRKYYVVLGFSENSVFVGGVVFNSRINLNMPETIRGYHYPVKSSAYSFLSHDSFINCATIIQSSIGKLEGGTVVGRLVHDDLEVVLGSVRECPAIPFAVKKYFGLV